MRDLFTVEEQDQQLVHALQLMPRASWGYLGSLLDTDPVMLARRWRRLHQAGVAWVTAVLPAAAADDFSMAFVDLECVPNRTLAIAQLLTGDPQAHTVYTCTGEYDVFAAIFTADLTDLGSYLTDRIGQVDGILRARTRVLTDLLIPVSTWELRALSQEQRRQLLADREPPAERRPDGALKPGDQEVFDELVLDGRISHTDLAERLGVSQSTARRRLTRLLESGTIDIRCDMTRESFGWPVSVLMWCTTGKEAWSAQQLRADVPEIRLCGAFSGTSDLALVLWLRRLSDLGGVEENLRRHVPGLAVQERTVLLASLKQSGHMLDRRGRPLGVVPTNVWSPAPTTAEAAHADW